ncbi:DEAD/DEAH box helicase [Candidatus Pacearchaeota archaeon]|nr:DEAD/DEAH box helicase [Candidatus Pacearchaeota archaeon]
MDNILKFLLNIQPRDYQKEIVKKCIEKNCLVVLPTGIGKTLIALMLAIDRLQKFPTEKILFLAPTRPLAQQHFTYFQEHLPELFAQMDLFTGQVEANKRKALWERADIVFSTPQCIANDIKEKLYDLSQVSLLIEDEAHRCVKNYSYTYVAKKYIEQKENNKENSRILGLTASPGTNKEAIKTICKNLSIEEVEIRTRESEDVKDYLQELEINVIKLEFPKEFAEIRNLLKKIYDKKTEELKSRHLLFGPINKVTLLEAQGRIMHSLATGNKNFNLFAGASAAAQALKIGHALELIETQTLYALDNYFQTLFEQARKSQSKAVKNLVANAEFNNAYIQTKNLISQNLEHPKLLELKDLIENKVTENPKAKIIVFSQYRDSVTKICKELNSLSNVTAKVFVGQAKKTLSNKPDNKENTTGLSQKEQHQIIQEFSRGEFNILCATSIAEEGLDICEVNIVVFYEPVPSAIRKIQRTGRTARLIPGEVIMLITKGTRDEAHYWSAYHKEKKMYKAIKEIDKEFKDNRQNEKQSTLDNIS